MNPLIRRKEVTFEVHGSATPKRFEVRRALAAMLKTDLDKVWLRRLHTKTGTHRTFGLAHVYDDAETALKVEPGHIIRRNQPPKEAAPAAEV